MGKRQWIMISKAQCLASLVGKLCTMWNLEILFRTERQDSPQTLCVHHLYRLKERKLYLTNILNKIEVHIICAFGASFLYWVDFSNLFYKLIDFRKTLLFAILSTNLSRNFTWQYSSVQKPAITEMANKMYLLKITKLYLWWNLY